MEADKEMEGLPTSFALKFATPRIQYDCITMGITVNGLHPFRLCFDEAQTLELLYVCNA